MSAHFGETRAFISFELFTAFPIPFRLSRSVAMAEAEPYTEGLFAGDSSSFVSFGCSS